MKVLCTFAFTFLLAGCGFISGKVLKSQFGYYAVTADINANSLSLYSMTEPGGQLKYLNSAATGSSGLNVIAVSPTGKFIYGPQSTAGGAIYGFLVNSDNQTLEPVAGSPVSGPGGSGQMAVFDPSGSFLYVSFTSPSVVNAYAVDQSTGALGLIASYPTGGTNSYFLTMDPLGRFLYITNYNSNNISGWKITPGTGALTVIGTPCAGVASTPISAAEDIHGKFYVVLYGASIVVFAIDQNTGALVLVQGPYAVGGSTQWVNFDPSGKFVLTASTGAGKGISSFSMDANTGALTVASSNTNGTGNSYETAVVDPSGTLIYSMSSATNLMNIFNFNMATGVVSAGTTMTTTSKSFSLVTFLTSYQK